MATIISKKRVRKPAGTITTKKMAGKLEVTAGGAAGIIGAYFVNNAIKKAVSAYFPAKDAPVSGIGEGKTQDLSIHGSGLVMGLALQAYAKNPTLNSLALGYSLFNALSLVKDMTGKSYLSGVRHLSGVTPNPRELAQVYPESMVDMLPPVEDTSLVSV